MRFAQNQWVSQLFSTVIVSAGIKTSYLTYNRIRDVY